MTSSNPQNLSAAPAGPKLAAKRHCFFGPWGRRFKAMDRAEDPHAHAEGASLLHKSERVQGFINAFTLVIFRSRHDLKKIGVTISEPQAL